MSQHDHDIANASGAAVRADINQVLAAIVTQNSGATEPATKFSFMFWADTTSNQLKMRNGANNAWIVLGSLDTTNLGLATKNSPALTGTPTAPTPATADDSTKIATTAMVQDAAQAKVDALNTISVNLDGTITSGRTVYVDTDAPSGGSNGDIWLEY
jgi:hypothetical protein